MAVMKFFIPYGLAYHEDDEVSNRFPIKRYAEFDDFPTHYQKKNSLKEVNDCTSYILITNCNQFTKKMSTKIGKSIC